MKPTNFSPSGIEIEGEPDTAKRSERILQRALSTRPASHAPKSARREAQKTQRADSRKKSR
jgi:hypothetical protein